MRLLPFLVSASFATDRWERQGHASTSPASSSLICVSPFFSSSLLLSLFFFSF